MVLLEFSMSPLGKGESVSAYVSKTIDIIDRSGLPYQTNAMGTIIEGEWDEVMNLVGRCFERMKEDCSRITATIKIDYRKGHRGRIRNKVESLERKLGRELSRS